MDGEYIEGLLRWVLEHPESRQYSFGDTLMDAARQNDKRPAWVKMGVPDKVVRDLTGDIEGLRPEVFVIVIPRETREAFWQRQRAEDAGIILS